jgi:acetylglutamate kinase
MAGGNLTGDMATPTHDANADAGLVVKYGGHAMTDPDQRRAVLADVRALAAAGAAPVLVHGGGPAIAAELAAAGIASRFERGLRVTTPESLPIVERAITMLGKRLAGELGDAVALTGRDAGVLVAARIDPRLGEVGSVREVRVALLQVLRDAGFVPLVGCLAIDGHGAALNVNADDAAAAVAAALRLPCVFLTNVPGVLDDVRDPASRITSLTRAQVAQRIADGRIAGGMIPKVESALAALERGAPAAVIADGRLAGELARVAAGGAGTRLVP